MSQLTTTLKQLKLSGMGHTLELRLQEAGANRLSHLEFLQLILQDEINLRDQKRIELAQAEQPFPSLDGAAVKTEAGSVRIDENSVDLEREVYELGENEIRFQTTTHMAKSYFRGLKNVIREGR